MTKGTAFECGVLALGALLAAGCGGSASSDDVAGDAGDAAADGDAGEPVLEADAAMLGADTGSSHLRAMVPLRTCFTPGAIVRRAGPREPEDSAHWILE